MGYDCTLHVVDEEQIGKAFVKALLKGSRPKNGTTADVDIAGKHWDATLQSLAEDPPKRAASTVCQLALVFSSKAQPYHYERGFALSLWADQPDGLHAKFPKSLTESPEMLFKQLLKQHPKLRGNFPTAFDGNGSTGTFISSKKVSKALKWVEGQVKKYDESDRELFRGLLLVLRHCAEHELAYWEGTDMPVPMATMQAAGAEARRVGRSFKWPDYGYEPLTQSGDIFVCAYRLGPNKEARTAIADFSAWPPALTWLEEYAVCASVSKTGKLVTVAAKPGECDYTVRLRKRARPDSEVQELSCERKLLGENGYDWASFLEEQVVGVIKFKKDKTPKRYPQFQEGVTLRDDKTFAAAADNHDDHFGDEPLRVGIAQTGDGSQVLVWRDGGFEKVKRRWQKTFPLATAPSYDDFSSVPAGPDGFFYLANRCLYEVHRGEPSIRHLFKLSNIMYLRPGPEGSLLLYEGSNKTGDWGKLYWPELNQMASLKPKLLPDVAKRDLHDLFWLESQQRLLVFTAEEVWFIPYAQIQELPRSEVI